MNKREVPPSRCANQVAYVASPSTSQQFVTKEDFEAYKKDFEDYKKMNNQQFSLIMEILSTLKA